MYELMFSMFALASLLLLLLVYIGGSRMKDKAAGYAMKSIAFACGVFVIFFWIAFMFSMTLIN